MTVHLRHCKFNLLKVAQVRSRSCVSWAEAEGRRVDNVNTSNTLTSDSHSQSQLLGELADTLHETSKIITYTPRGRWNVLCMECEKLGSVLRNLSGKSADQGAPHSTGPSPRSRSLNQEIAPLSLTPYRWDDPRTCCVRKTEKDKTDLINYRDEVSRKQPSVDIVEEKSDRQPSSLGAADDQCVVFDFRDIETPLEQILNQMSPLPSYLQKYSNTTDDIVLKPGMDIGDLGKIPMSGQDLHTFSDMGHTLYGVFCHGDMDKQGATTCQSETNAYRTDRDAITSEVTESRDTEPQIEGNIICQENFRVTFVSEQSEQKCIPVVYSMEGTRSDKRTDSEPVLLMSADDPAILWSKEEGGTSPNVNKEQSVEGQGGDKEDPKLDPFSKPSLDQLILIRDHFTDYLPKLFVKGHDYRIYRQDMVLENNYWEKPYVTRGLYAYVLEVVKVRLMAHLAYANVKFVILNITTHEEDGTVRVRWRISGIPQSRAFMFWKFLPWAYKRAKEKESQWNDGFSIFYVGGDGLIYKHKVDRVMPNEEKEPIKIPGLALKLGFMIGLMPKASWEDGGALFMKPSDIIGWLKKPR